MTTGELVVTVVTAGAGQDALSDADYREIYAEVRGFDEASGKYAVSLDEFVGLIGSVYSKAAWSKYHRDEMPLNRVMRGELRRAVGLPVLPPTVGEAVAGVDADATVVQVGDDDLVRRVVLVGGDAPVTVHWNGDVRAWVSAGCSPGKTRTVAEFLGLVTPVTRSRRGVFVAVSVFDRVNALRRSQGLSWAQVFAAAESALGGHGESVADGAGEDGVGVKGGSVLG
jgi:hypothetical protein